jgi:serine/threonine protein kinase
VRQVRDRNDPSKIFAVKSIPIEKLKVKFKDAKDYMKEVEIMKGLRHPNIIQLVDSFLEVYPLNKGI